MLVVLERLLLSRAGETITPDLVNYDGNYPSTTKRSIYQTAITRREKN